MVLQVLVSRTDIQKK